MNYLIIDTEKTYNIGYLIVSEKKEILTSKEFVVKAHFEDRRICGEINYKRKLKFFSQNKHIVYATPLQAMQSLIADIKKYQIKTILGQNVSEDRIQLGQLFQETNPYLAQSEKTIFDSVEYFDIQKITRALLPNNKMFNLSDLMNDILGGGFIQTHTALEDAKLCWILLEQCVEFMPLFLTDEYLHWFDNISQHLLATITQTITPSKTLYDKRPTNNYTVKAFNSRCHLFAERGFLVEKEVNKIGAKGNVLKTTELAVAATSSLVAIKQLYNKFLTINWTQVLETISVSAATEYNLDLSELKQKITTNCEKTFLEKEQQLNNKYKAMEKALNERAATLAEHLKVVQKQMEETQKGALIFYQNLNNKEFKKEVKALTKELKKRQISQADFVYKICNLSVKL